MRSRWRAWSVGTAEERASFYDGSDRLVAVDQRKSGRTMLEEFRYDPLGRRVCVSNTTRCAPTTAIECLTSCVRRILWDGDREIAEISAPRNTTNLALEELDANFPLQPSITLGAGQYGDPNTHFGRVLYSPGLAIDQPMSVTRYEYKDAPPAGTTLSWAPFTQMVLWDYRGTAALGLYTDGAWAKPYQLAPGQTDCPIPGLTGPDRCVLGQWAVVQSAYDQARAPLPNLSWMGSLLRNKRDGTGLEYKRNRVYDPQTGRFTQEDPIGLAGGLNLYGFANGDPVNFSDPFGLQGCPKYSFETPSGTCLSAPAALGAAITMAFQSAATAFRALRGGAAAEGVAASRAGARNVGEQLAYQELAPGVARNAGIEIAGGASKARFRGAAGYAEKYGGDASDWVKKSTNWLTRRYWGQCLPAPLGSEPKDWPDRRCETEAIRKDALNPCSYDVRLSRQLRSRLNDSGDTIGQANRSSLFRPARLT